MKNIVKYNGELGTLVNDYDNKELIKFLPCDYGRYYTRDLQTVNQGDVEEATFEEKIKFIKTEYSWGRVVQVHVIGEYQIIEDNKGRFHPYINFNNNYSASYTSLDSALIGVICHKHEGGNGRLNSYIYKILDLEW